MILARTVDATRHYGDAVALADVSFEIRAGELVDLLGPNGAGKSTLLNLLVGLRRPTSGRVELFGGDPRDAVNGQQIGVTPQETGLPPTLRVGECVDYVAAHFTDPIGRDELLDRFGLDGLARRQTGGCPVDSDAAWRWRWPSSAGPAWSFSMNRPPAST